MAVIQSPVDIMELSVIIPVTERYGDVETVYREYRAGVEECGLDYEIIYVLDGSYPEVLAKLKQLIAEGESLKVISLSKWFGESTALNVAFEHCRGDRVLSLPAYQQIDAREIPKLIDFLDEADMVLARRFPRRDGLLSRAQSKVFNYLLGFVSALEIQDAGCGARAFRRRVIDEIYIYGDQHRFLPLMAHHQGFKVKEIDVAQSDMDTFRRIYPIGVYSRQLLDILTIFFLVKFTKKPLRFFGLLGAGTGALGAITTAYVVAERFIFGIPLAERPALVLGCLLIVMGIQVMAIGLLGELVIFTHAREIKEYTVEEIIN